MASQVSGGEPTTSKVRPTLAIPPASSPSSFLLLLRHLPPCAPWFREGKPRGWNRHRHDESYASALLKERPHSSIPSDGAPSICDPDACCISSQTQLHSPPLSELLLPVLLHSPSALLPPSKLLPSSDPPISSPKVSPCPLLLCAAALFLLPRLSVAHPLPAT